MAHSSQRARKAAPLLLRAIEKDFPQLDEYTTEYLTCVAHRIAQHLGKTHTKNQKAFAAAVRTLCYNLPQPHNLDKKIKICANLLPISVVSADSAFWVSPETRARELERAERKRKQCIVDQRSAATRISTKPCSACGATEAWAFYSTRRTSHKADTWGSKDHEDSMSARLECTGCAKQWHEDEPFI